MGERRGLLCKDSRSNLTLARSWRCWKSNWRAMAKLLLTNTLDKCFNFLVINVARLLSSWSRKTLPENKTSTFMDFSLLADDYAYSIPTCDSSLAVHYAYSHYPMLQNIMTKQWHLPNKWHCCARILCMNTCIDIVLDKNIVKYIKVNVIAVHEKAV